MHHQRIPALPGPPARGTPEYHVQRAVLLELLLARPNTADPVDSLADTLDASIPDIRSALAALAAAGLVDYRDDAAAAAAAARYLEALLYVSL
jgi:hypothetical protein